MGWLISITKVNHYLSFYQQPLSLPQPPPSSPTLQSGNFKVDNTKVSPSVLLILVIISLIFFISGLLHLLIRFLFRPSHRDPEDLENVTVLQGQLQQLFHLHDAGVDQSFIDTLPVFIYKAIIGLKNPFDCAVCLCEFEADDKLRLLPDCSHAFHMECIDTWLLSHSTCPLCRGSLLPDFSVNNSCSPIVLVLESGSESSREIVLEREAVPPSDNYVLGTINQLGCHGEDELNSSCNDPSQKSNEIPAKQDVTVVSVKLGKFRNVDGVAGADESSSNNSSVDARRCLSMGSFEYVMDGNSSLKVAIRTHIRKQTSKKPSLPLTPGHKPAMSECDCLDAMRSTEFYHENNISTGNVVGRSKRESLSISKIWLRSKEKPLLTSKEDSSRRTFSFRLPLHPISVEDSNVKNTCSSRTISDVEVARWENCGSELDFNEVGSCNSLDTQFKSPSFARRTLLWLVGRQNKVVNSCSLPNV